MQEKIKINCTLMSKEKAKSLLNSAEVQKALNLGYLDVNQLKRPRRVQNVEDLKLAEKWRSQVMSEINHRVTKLHDELINDYQIRDLNDEVNKLAKEKTAWDYRIKELGGVSSHSAVGGVRLNNYRYFGRAKELPEVKRLMDLKAQKENSDEVVEVDSSKEIHDKIDQLDLNYYGFIDDPELVKAEGEVSKAILKTRKKLDGAPSEVLNHIADEKITLKQAEEYLVERKRRLMLQKLNMT